MLTESGLLNDGGVAFNHRSASHVVSIIIVVCVGFLVFMIALGVIRIRAAHSRSSGDSKGGAGSCGGGVDEESDLAWDDSPLNIIVNPLDQMAHGGSHVLGEEGSTDEDDDDEDDESYEEEEDGDDAIEEEDEEDVEEMDGEEDGGSTYDEQDDEFDTSAGAANSHVTTSMATRRQQQQRVCSKPVVRSGPRRRGDLEWDESALHF